MRKIRVSQKQFALLCAVVLVAVSTVAAVRQSGWLADVQRQFADDSIALQPSTPGTASKSAEDPAKKSVQPEVKPAESIKQPVVEEKTAESKAPQGNYVYMAESGDSYTLFARDAIEQYCKARNIDVTDSQLLQAESILVNAAETPMLDVGQSVTITKDAVAQALQIAGAVATATTI